MANLRSKYQDIQVCPVKSEMQYQDQHSPVLRIAAQFSSKQSQINAPVENNDLVAFAGVTSELSRTSSNRCDEMRTEQALSLAIFEQDDPAADQLSTCALVFTS